MHSRNVAVVELCWCCKRHFQKKNLAQRHSLCLAKDSSPVEGQMRRLTVRASRRCNFYGLDLSKQQPRDLKFSVEQSFCYRCKDLSGSCYYMLFIPYTCDVLMYFNQKHLTYADMRYGAHVDSFGLTILNLDPRNPEGLRSVKNCYGNFRWVFL